MTNRPVLVHKVKEADSPGSEVQAHPDGKGPQRVPQCGEHQSQSLGRGRGTLGRAFKTGVSRAPLPGRQPSVTRTRHLRLPIS